MEENEGSELKAAGESLGDIHCPKCGGIIQGATAGKKDKCPFDDCGQQFSIRYY